VGDFACLYNKVSEFLYKPQDHLEGFAIKKENFQQIINEDKFGSRLIPRMKKIYKSSIRDPINAHRDIQARKFQTRIDYVDLSAFGVGVKFDDFDNYKADCDQIDKTIQKYCCKYGRLVQKLEDVEKKLDQFMH